MVYQFDLQVPDYVAAGIAATNTSRIVRGYMPYAVIAGLIAWIIAYVVNGQSARTAAVAGVVVFALFLGYLLFMWRSTFTKHLTKHYESPGKRVILGPHALELADDGLHSQGPLHRSFRAWPSITQAVFTRSHCVLQTAFSIMYVLPLRAVPDREVLKTLLREKHVPITGA
jgi:hypothetical protein